MPARCSPSKLTNAEALLDPSNFSLASEALFRGSSPSSVSDASPVQPASDPDIENLKFVAYGIIGCVVIALGILGNVINLAVLTQPSLKGVTFIYLTWLATSDLMTLLVSITSMMRLHGVQPRSYPAAIYFAYVELPLVNAFMASSVFLVVALTVDRYFSVCLPTRFKEVHNMRRCRNSIICAYVVAFALYVPICFQKSPVEVENPRNETEYIACEEGTVVSHPVFKIYLLIKEVIVRIGPVVVLAILNTTIIVTFRKTLKKRQNMLGQNASVNATPTAQSNKKFREERRLLALLGGIVIMFFLCMTPAAALTILNSDDKESDFSFQVFRAMANCLELANYSMNFYVYCMCSPDFRRTFVGLFTCCTKVRDEAKGRRLSTAASTIRADANSINAVAGSSIECSTKL